MQLKRVLETVGFSKRGSFYGCLIVFKLLETVGSFSCYEIVLDISVLYRVIRNDCRGLNNLSYTLHLR